MSGKSLAIAAATKVLVVLVGGVVNAQAQSIFPDPNLEAAVAATLGQSPVTLSNLPALTCLSAANRQITNLAGLDHATNLAALFIAGNAIQDLSPLRTAIHLTSLDAGQNAIQNLAPLKGLTNLNCLVLSQNPVTNYSAISNLTGLQTFTVREGQLRDLTVLQPLKQLRSLILWNNGILDASPLAQLTNLASLDLRWNSLGHAGTQKAWPTNLVSLYLGGNSFSNAPALPFLPHLTLLDLEDNRIHDLAPISGLTNLTYLSLNRNPVTNYAALAPLTHLGGLELRGNSLTNIAFVTSLPQLTFLDLSFNQINSLTALLGLTNLRSLVLAGNPVTNYFPLTAFSQLSNLWLFANAISNATFVTNLTKLKYANLEQNCLTDISPLLALTNLTGLALSRNPATNYSLLDSLINLSSLRIEGDFLIGADFLTNLTQLTFLSLAQNQITDPSPLTNLVNLHDLYLRRNRLSNPQSLLNLSALANLDLSLNFLDLRPGSSSLSAIRALQSQRTGFLPCNCGTGNASATQCEGVNVIYQPTNQPPSLSALPKWFIPCNTNSQLAIGVSEYPPPVDPLNVTLTLPDTNLLSITTNPLVGLNNERILELAAGCNPLTNTVQLSLNVTDDVGLTASAVVQVIVVPDISLAALCPNTDSNLVTAISWAADKAASDLALVDLLSLTNLSLVKGAPDDSCLWSWLTNIAEIEVAGQSVSNLNFLTNLTQLNTLEIDGTEVMDLSPVTALGGLNVLRIRSTPATNLPSVSAMRTLKNLDLTDNALSDLSFLTNLTQLTSLRLDDNRIIDLSPLLALTNLQFLYLQQNLLTDLDSLTNLTGLLSVDLRFNLLDLSPQSPAMAAVERLQNARVMVAYWPQRGPPVINAPPSVFVAANSTSAISFVVSDRATYPAQFVLAANSANPNLIPDANLWITPATNGTSTLTLWPANGQIGSGSITLMATNDAGLGTAVAISVVVIIPQIVVFPDPNLAAGLIQAWKVPGSVVTTVQLLGNTSLILNHAAISNLAGLEWATNLVSLNLDNNALSDLSPLTNMSQLVSLSASNNLIHDFSPLTRLPLQYLNLSENPITNYNEFLTGWGSLTALALAGNSLTNVSCLSNLRSLSALYLDNNSLQDLSPLASLVNLRDLSLSGNDIANLSFLAGLTQLNSLNLASNVVCDLSSLGNLTNLARLELNDNIITNIAALQDLPALKYLDLQLNQLDLSAGSQPVMVISSLAASGASLQYALQYPLDSDGDGMPDYWETANALNPYSPADATMDLDGDGRPNVMEFALGTDPNNPADGNVGLALSTLSDGTRNFLALSFRRRIHPVQILYEPQVSGDGLNWFSDPSHLQQVSVIPLNDEFSWVTVRDLTPLAPATARFFRLRILAGTADSIVNTPNSPASRKNFRRALPPPPRSVSFPNEDSVFIRCGQKCFDLALAIEPC